MTPPKHSGVSAVTHTCNCAANNNVNATATPTTTTTTTTNTTKHHKSPPPPLATAAPSPSPSNGLDNNHAFVRNSPFLVNKMSHAHEPVGGGVVGGGIQRLTGEKRITNYVQFNSIPPVKSSSVNAIHADGVAYEDDGDASKSMPNHIIASSQPLHEDDLSNIDVKRLVSCWW